MRQRVSRRFTATSAVAVCLLFLAAFCFGGIRVGAVGTAYDLFGVVDGLAAIVILYVLLNTEVLSWPKDAWGGLVLVYAWLGTSQMVGLLLPPPGVLEWFVLGMLIVLSWGASYGVHRTRIILALGLAAIALAALNYSVLPFIWSATQLPETPLVDLRALGESVKRLFIAYEPTAPITQFFALTGIIAWSGAVWLDWPPAGEDDWIRQLPRGERDRLLSWMLEGGGGRPIDSGEARGYLESPDRD